MKKKILALIVTAFIILPCMALFAACGDVKVSGLKVKVNGQEYTETSTTKVELTYGTEVSFEAVAVYSDDSEKAIIADDITIVDENNIIGTKPNVGEYQINFGYKGFEIEVTVKINPIALAVPTTSSSFTFNGENQTIELDNFNSQLMAVSGNTQKNAGDYSAVVSLLDKVNYVWADGTTEDKQISWGIEKLAIAKPTKTTQEYYYNGDVQNLALTGFDSNLMEKVEGCFGTDASSYVAVIGLKDKVNCVWLDNTTENIGINWSINKIQAVAPAHAALSGTYDKNKTLLDYVLDEGFTWVDATIVPTVNVTSYAAKYNLDSDNYSDANVTITLNLQKAQAVAPAHDAFSGTYDKNKTLLDYVLDEGFTWVDATIVPTVNVTSYSAKYNLDSVNYNDAEVEVALNLSKADAVWVNYQGALSGTYDENKTLLDYVLASGYAWADQTVVPTVSVTEYDATYNTDAINYNDAVGKIVINVSPKQVAKPVVSENQNLVYNGESQTIEIENGDGLYLTVSGDELNQTNAGEYNVTFTINDNNYIFADESSLVELTWEIAKKEVEIKTTNLLVSYMMV